MSFWIFSALHHEGGGLQAGQFSLEPTMSVGQIVDVLRRGTGKRLGVRERRMGAAKSPARWDDAAADADTHSDADPDTDAVGLFRQRAGQWLGVRERWLGAA